MIGNDGLLDELFPPQLFYIRESCEGFYLPDAPIALPPDSFELDLLQLGGSFLEVSCGAALQLDGRAEAHSAASTPKLSLGRSDSHTDLSPEGRDGPSVGMDASAELRRYPLCQADRETAAIPCKFELPKMLT